MINDAAQRNKKKHFQEEMDVVHNNLLLIINLLKMETKLVTVINSLQTLE